MSDADLVTAVDAATAWAIAQPKARGTAPPPRATAHAELARFTARQIVDPDLGADGKPPALAPLLKELRATLETLETMRDGDDGTKHLAAVLSAPVRYSA